MNTDRKNALLSATGLDEAQINYLYRVFLDDLKDHLVLIRESYDSGRWEEIRKLVHKIKAGITFFGGERMQELSEHLLSMSHTETRFIAVFKDFLAEATQLTEPGA